ncbi:MAG: hypothetical protein AAGF32_07510, partial [Pseudomonadota bacterium]
FWSAVAGVIVVGVLAVTAVVLAAQRYVFDAEIDPDAPRPFGYGTTWLAVPNATTQDVAEALGLQATQHANWYTGLDTVYDAELDEHYVYVAPPVGGQVFVVGRALPHPVGPRFVDQCRPLLLGLSTRFGAVSYLVSHRELALYGWARIENGRVVRAFAWGDEGVIWNAGSVTQAELDLNLTVLSGGHGAQTDAGDDIGYPDEDDVVRMAAHWNADPTRLGAPSGFWAGIVGVVGGLHRWRQGGTADAYGQLAPAPKRWRTRPMARMPQLTRVRAPVNSRAPVDAGGVVGSDSAGHNPSAHPGASLGVVGHARSAPQSDRQPAQAGGSSGLPHGRGRAVETASERAPEAAVSGSARPTGIDKASGENGVRGAQTPGPRPAGPRLRSANDDTRMEETLPGSRSRPRRRGADTARHRHPTGVAQPAPSRPENGPTRPKSPDEPSHGNVTPLRPRK